ncbi:MAG: glycoside hydrolase family 5 protein, partial [Bacteroides sp.]
SSAADVHGEDTPGADITDTDTQGENTPDASSPIDPWTYQRILGKGVDVDWCKTKHGMENYSSRMVDDFKAAGVSHVRIRIKDDADEQLLSLLDRQVSDCLSRGIIPVIAYQADYMKNSPDSENIQRVAQWWTTVAEHFQNVSYLVSFDLIIEVTDELNKQPDTLNEIYEKLVSAVRKTNPKRIIMISPRYRSDASYLNDLKIPSEAGGYLMAEWHFYAAGPSKDNEKKMWTTGKDEEKQLIVNKVNTALEWQKKNNIPTWVGAWMPGNYNDGNDYSVSEQTVFAAFMTQTLSDAGIPFAINADTHFYDSEKNIWIEDMQPVFKAVFSN